MIVFKIIQHGFGQAEIRNAIAQHTADFILPLKNRHLISLAGEDYRDGQSRRAGADDRRTHAVGRRRAFFHLLGIGRGNVLLNRREMHRHAIAAQHTMPLALLFMTADHRTDARQRIILKEHFARLVHFASKHQLNHVGDWRVNRAAALAHGILAVETAARFLQNMHRHIFFLSKYEYIYIS